MRSSGNEFVSESYGSEEEPGDFNKEVEFKPTKMVTDINNTD
jgi:hypothetical protein